MKPPSDVKFPHTGLYDGICRVPPAVVSNGNNSAFVFRYSPRDVFRERLQSMIVHPIRDEEKRFVEDHLAYIEYWFRIRQLTV